MKTVYLAGPIADCTDEEANGWRHEAIRGLREKFRVLNPMRRDTRGRRLSYIQCCELVESDLDDIRTSDILLVYIHKPSAGTSMELVYARKWGKTIIVVIPDTSMIEDMSPWVRYHASIICKSVREGIVQCLNHEALGF